MNWYRGCCSKVTALLELASFIGNVGQPLSQLGSNKKIFRRFSSLRDVHFWLHIGVPKRMSPTDFHRPMTLNVGILAEMSQWDVDG